MSLWTRVFGRLEAMPDATGLQVFLAELGVSSRFEADDAGWYRAEIDTGPGSPLIVERWLADEEGIRAELNSWAAYLETCDWSPHHGALMEQAIQSRQLFTLRKALDHADEPRTARVCAALAQELARLTNGFWQTDGVGFLDATGAVLVEEF